MRSCSVSLDGVSTVSSSQRARKATPTVLRSLWLHPLPPVAGLAVVFAEQFYRADLNMITKKHAHVSKSALYRTALYPSAPCHLVLYRAALSSSHPFQAAHQIQVRLELQAQAFSEHLV